MAIIPDLPLLFKFILSTIVVYVQFNLGWHALFLPNTCTCLNETELFPIIQYEPEQNLHSWFCVDWNVEFIRFGG